MYKVGDYVICRNGGVWRVAGIDADEIRLIEHESDAEKILSASSTEMIRKIASKETILDVIQRVPYIRTIQAPNNKVRISLYDEAMAKYDEIEWLKIIKTVYLRRQEKRLIPNELEYGEKAKGYLHGEISILLEMPVNEVEKYIKSAVLDF
jgi:CarD family transcriptional regulator